MNLRNAFFGYAKQDVQAILAEFKRRIQEMDRLSKEKDSLIVDYQEKIQGYQNRERLINDALKDARTIANAILQKAETEAKQLMVSTEALTDKQLANAREDIRHLDEIKEKITEHERTMRQELLNLIEQQKAVVENFDLSTFEAASQNISNEVAKSDKVIQDSKIRVVLPSEVPRKTTDENVIPLYSLK